MISPNEIKIKAERKYFSFLQSVVQAIPFSRIVITGDKTYNKTSIADFHNEILALANQSKEKKGFGFTIEYQTVKTKTLGMQSLPTIIYFDSEKDFLKFLGKEKEVDIFIDNWRLIHSNFPELKDWIIKKDKFSIAINTITWIAIVFLTYNNQMTNIYSIIFLVWFYISVYLKENIDREN